MDCLKGTPFILVANVEDLIFINSFLRNNGFSVMVNVFLEKTFIFLNYSLAVYPAKILKCPAFFFSSYSTGFIIVFFFLNSLQILPRLR